MSSLTDPAASGFTPKTASLNTEAAIERMGDRELYLEIAHYFAEHLEESLNKLHHALQSNTLADATRLAHSLKGNCATVGADELREECYTLEKLCRDGSLSQALAFYETLSPQLLHVRSLLRNL